MTRIVVATAVVMALIAQYANAQGGLGTQQSVEHCKALQQQYQIDRQKPTSAKKMAESQTLYNQGVGLCNTEQQKQGIKTLKAGLQRVGVKPKTIVYSSVYSSH